MKKREPGFIPVRIQKVVQRCSGGGYVIKTMPLASQGERVPKWSYSDGRDAPELSVNDAIQRGLILPCQDGLFGGESSQTYRAPA